MQNHVVERPRTDFDVVGAFHEIDAHRPPERGDHPGGDGVGGADGTDAQVRFLVGSFPAAPEARNAGSGGPAEHRTLGSVADKNKSDILVFELARGGDDGIPRAVKT